MRSKGLKGVIGVVDVGDRRKACECRKTLLERWLQNPWCDADDDDDD